MILKHVCNVQTFKHKISEKIQTLPHASLQELKFIVEFIEEIDTKHEIQNEIIDHIEKKRFPKTTEKSLSGSDSSLHLALQYKILMVILQGMPYNCISHVIDTYVTK